MCIKRYRHGDIVPYLGASFKYYFNWGDDLKKKNQMGWNHQPVEVDSFSKVDAPFGSICTCV